MVREARGIVEIKYNDDIVHSIWGHIAVHKRTGRGVTASSEYKSMALVTLK